MSRRHEQLLFRYSRALERGDFEIVADVLREAERDPVLEQMILEMNEVYAAERLNHTNSREVLMIASRYQTRPQVGVQWHNLALTAALAVIGLLSLLLAAQIRTNTFASGGQGGSPIAAAQANSICQATVQSPADVHTQPQPDSLALGSIPTGTVVAVLDQAAISGGEAWFFVSAQGMQGWIPAEMLDASACPPTLTPANVEATAIPVVGVPSGNGLFMPVFVQPGENVISILNRLNIDLGELPEIMRLNNLTDTSGFPGSADLPRGTILLVPLPNLGGLLTCTLQGQEQIEVLTDPSDGAQVVMTLQAGDNLDVFTQPVEDWYVAIVEHDGTTMSSVYVRIRDVEQLASGDCQQAAITDANATPSADASPVTPDLQAFVTVIPSGTFQSYPTCFVTVDHAVDIFSESSKSAHVIEIASTGTQLEIDAPLQQSDGLWYWIRIVTPGQGTSGFVMPGSLVLPDACPYALLGNAVATPLADLSTMTPIPTLVR